MKQKGKILLDHKLIGKKYIPPFYHKFKDWDSRFVETSYIDKILPEIIWQGFLNEKFGVSKAVRITLKLLDEIRIARRDEKDTMFCYISNFTLLNEKQIDKNWVKYFLTMSTKSLLKQSYPF